MDSFFPSSFALRKVATVFFILNSPFLSKIGIIHHNPAPDVSALQCPLKPRTNAHKFPVPLPAKHSNASGSFSDRPAPQDPSAHLLHLPKLPTDYYVKITVSVRL